MNIHLTQLAATLKYNSPTNQANCTKAALNQLTKFRPYGIVNI